MQICVYFYKHSQIIHVISVPYTFQYEEHNNLYYEHNNYDILIMSCSSKEMLCLEVRYIL